MNRNDQMTPMERLGGFLTGGDMDRILAMPLICSMSGKCAGMTHKEKRSTAENEAKCQIEAYNRFGNDVLIAEYGLHTVGKSLGSKMSDPEDAVPAIIDHVLKDLADIDQLDFERVKLKNSKDFQLHLECAKILIERMGKEVPTGTCGDTKKIIPEMLKTKPDMISIDNRVPIGFAKELIQPYMPLVGNVDPVETMILGTPEDVDKAVKHCIKEAYDSKNGYILCTGCDLNGNIPLENLDAFMNAARKYGKFPISSSNWE